MIYVAAAAVGAVVGLAAGAAAALLGLRLVRRRKPTRVVVASDQANEVALQVIRVLAAREAQTPPRRPS